MYLYFLQMEGIHLEPNLFTQRGKSRSRETCEEVTAMIPCLHNPGRQAELLLACPQLQQQDGGRDKDRVRKFHLRKFQKLLSNNFTESFARKTRKQPPFFLDIYVPSLKVRGSVTVEEKRMHNKGQIAQWSQSLYSVHSFLEYTGF